MYLDSAYIAKFYLNEADSLAVRRLLSAAENRVSSVWAIAEVTCAFHRHVREGRLSPTEHARLAATFLEHVETDVWRLKPVTDRLLRTMTRLTQALPASVYVRAGDALHLTTAMEMGETEIWSNDKHLLAAASHFGLTGRSA